LTIHGFKKEVTFMSDSVIDSASVQAPGVIPWEERVHDNDNKIEEYFRNCHFRGCNPDTTIRALRTEIHSLLRRVEVADPAHPQGKRQLLIWELLDPRRGPYYLGLLIASLVADDLAPDTRRKYMSDLRYFCEYVMAKPHVPGAGGLTLTEKYGPLALPFTRYDQPVHAQDRPRKKRYALAPKLRDDFFEILRTDYLPNHPTPHVAARNYTAVVLKAEVGARLSELVGIRSGGESRDIDYPKGTVRLFGKAKPYSGKRIRRVPLTPLAAEVLSVFEKVFRPMFLRSAGSEYLFPGERREQFTKYEFWKAFKEMVAFAGEAGLPVPEDLKPHDLRRTFATNELEKNPLGYRGLLRKMGHSYPSSTAPYIIACDEDEEETRGDLIDIFIDPYVDKRGAA
jgi:integrase